jgi:hypothetical protein
MHPSWKHTDSQVLDANNNVVPPTEIVRIANLHDQIATELQSCIGYIGGAGSKKKLADIRTLLKKIVLSEYELLKKENRFFPLTQDDMSDDL